VINNNTYIHTTHALFPNGEEASQIFLRDTHVLLKLLSYEEYCRRGGHPIAVWSQSISGVSAINPLVAFYDVHGRKRGVQTDENYNNKILYSRQNKIQTSAENIIILIIITMPYYLIIFICFSSFQYSRSTLYNSFKGGWKQEITHHIDK
jgi:hypothetical protein